MEVHCLVVPNSNRVDHFPEVKKEEQLIAALLFVLQQAIIGKGK